MPDGSRVIAHDLYEVGIWLFWLRRICVVPQVERQSNRLPMVPPTVGELEHICRQLQDMPKAHGPSAADEPSARLLRRRLSSQVIEELVTRYNQGESARALGQEFGVSKTGLRELLLSEGVQFRKQGLAPADIERAAQLYESGLTIAEVASQVGFSYSAVRAALHKRGVPLRAAGRSGAD